MLKSKRVIGNTKSDALPLLNQFVWGGVFLLGGFLLVATLLLTNAHLSSPNALSVLYSGCVAGIALVVVGAFGIGVFRLPK